MKKIILVLFLQITCCVFGQAPSIEWQKCLGGSLSDTARSIQQTSDGGYIVAGQAYSNNGDVSGNHGNQDIWIVKLNDSGTIQWQKCLGGGADDIATSIQQTLDGGYIVSGHTLSNNGDVSGNHGLNDFWIIKLNDLGTIQWQKCLGGSADDIATSIQQTPDGGYIVAGYTLSNNGDVSGNHGLNDFWIVKLNNSGTIQWQKCLGGSNQDLSYIISIQQTSDGGYIVAGETSSNDGDVSGNHGLSDFWIVKLNNSGTIQWQKCLGGSNQDSSCSIQQTSDGGYVVTGYASSNNGNVSGNHGGADIWIVKLNDSGAIQWQKCLGGSSAEFPMGIQQTLDGGYIVAGYTMSNNGDVSGNHGNQDIWIVKLNDSGTIQWQKCLGGSADEFARSIQQTMDGGFVVAGHTLSNNGDVSGNHGSIDFWIVKLSAEISPTAPPIADPQTFCSQATVADLVATGIDLKWYDTATDGELLSNTTALSSNVYYVSQTINGVESDRVPVTVTINPIVTPLFVAIAPICSGATLAALPTTSTNGISGTWSPAMNNTETTTYTFTPSVGECAISATMVIAVNSNVTPAFTQVAPICSGATLEALPTTSTNGISGTWSPATNNTETTTYTFTPSVGECAISATMVITVNSNVTPAFTQVAPICSGATLAALPTTSTNGITGTWSPATNNTETTTYTFTPSVGECATSATMVITVNSNVTPAFTQVAPICSGATLAALPTTSTNGITGTWSPAINNTATTTYTFTPNVGQCATNITIVITVNSNVTPAFTQVAPICSGAALAALPTTSTNGITGTWSPATNNTETTTYTFTPSVGECATSATMVITVNSNVTPAFTQVAPICSGSTLAALPTTSTNGITGTWSPAINNTATTTYTFTPNAGQCATTRTMVITVNSNVTPAFTQVAPICSGATLAALPTTSTNGISGTWSPAINNTATTTYTFTPNAGQCATTRTMVITVNSNVTPAFTQVAPICSGSTLAALPTTSTNGITGTWSPAMNNTATTTYTFTPNAGQCATTRTMVITVNPNVTPAFTQVAPICSGAALAALPTTSTNGITGTWSPALNNTATMTYTFTPSAGQCAVATTMVITVNPNLTPAFTQVAPICSGAALAALPTTSTNGITGTWSPSLNNTATTTYTFTPSAGQCAVATTMVITVNPNLTPAFTQVAPICSGAALAALPTTSTNGITGTWSPAINNTATTTYTFTPNAGQCATTRTMVITVNSNVAPAFTQVAPICSGATLAALPTTSTNGISGTWSPAINNTATTTYTFTPNVGQCATTITMVITVNSNVTPAFTQVAPICSGVALVALPMTSTNGITGTWSPALNNTATTTYTFTPNPGQCATTRTMVIAVNSNITPAFTQVAPICSGAALAALPTTSTNGISGTWSPALNNLATTTYTFTPDLGQCAFSATMTIGVNTIDATTILVSETITANQTDAIYQWINCDGNTPIVNAVSQSFTATQNGNFAVIVSVGDCSVTSGCTAITTLAVENHNIETLVIYPNPATSYLNIQTRKAITSVKITDISGRKIVKKLYSANEIDVSDLSSGIYIIEIQTPDGVFRKKFIKN